MQIAAIFCRKRPCRQPNRSGDASKIAKGIAIASDFCHKENLQDILWEGGGHLGPKKIASISLACIRKGNRNRRESRHLVNSCQERKRTPDFPPDISRS